MFTNVFPGQQYPGDEEAGMLLEDFVATTVEWQVRMQRAHDLIKAVIGNREAHQLMPSLRRGLQDAFDTLCWALGHKKNRAFQSTLDLIEAVLRGVGAELPEAH